jgi:hypothetical protein
MHNDATKHVLQCQELEHLLNTEFVFNLHVSYILDANVVTSQQFISHV